MARPRLSPREGVLLPIAEREVRARGSKAARGKVIADEVARLAILDVLSPADDMAGRIELGIAAIERPAIVALATSAEIDTAAIVAQEAVRQFEDGGCRRVPPNEWKTADAELRAAVAKRLAGRYRKALK